MKKISLVIIAATITLFSISSCGSSSSKESTSMHKTDSVYNDSSTSIKNFKDAMSIENYRLISIFGSTGPKGAFYEYDSVKAMWCDRPMAADMMAYGRQNNIDNPEDIPDLSTYFDNQVTNRLNSCQISIGKDLDSTNFVLKYRGNLIFEYTFANSKNKGSKQKEINVNELKNFDLTVDDGSMVLSDAKKFVISIGENPSISFSNEYGSYDMSFVNVKGVSKGTKEATIISDRAFFYKEPNVLTKRKAYMIKGQAVNYEKVSGDFFYGFFINTQGDKTEGWMLKSDVNNIE
jgi:hypothetical protein